MIVINPSTEERRELEETPLIEIGSAVTRARTQQRVWAEFPLKKRIETIEQLAPLLEEKREILAETIVLDMGKPFKRALREVDASIDAITFNCRQATAWLSNEVLDAGYVCFDPLGVVAVIAPWNFPVITSIHPIIPALLSGNAVIYKPSELSLFTGKLLGELISNLEGLPKGLFETVIGGKEHGKTLVESPIDMVAFTGSTQAGKDIMRRGADKMKRMLLELGGMDAAIVLKDADIEKSAADIVRANCNNSGQVCCSIKRVYVESSVYKDFLKAAVKESERILIGDPTSNVDMGPLVAHFQLEKIERIVEDAKKKGALIHTGGKRLSQPGYFYPSTVISNVSADMSLLTEEPFGPLLPIMEVSDWQEAVTLSNESPYGLTGSVWTSNLELGESIARKLEVGVASLNSHGPGPMGAPWGGAKQSGLGRLKCKEGMRSFTNEKFVKTA